MGGIKTGKEKGSGLDRTLDTSDREETEGELDVDW